MTTQTNAQIIAKELYAAGVRYVFGQPGGEVVDLIEAMAQEGIEFVLMGHESAAALAAATLGLATGVPGVCLATLGPGACNFTLGIADAYLDRHPLLAISARTPDDPTWYNHQRLPLNEMFEPITKDSISLTDHACDEQIQYAIQTALTPPCGPVYLTIPGPVAVQPPNPNGWLGQKGHFNIPSEPEEIAAIAVALNQAKRPVVVVGLALDQHKDGAALREFLRVTGLPYGDTPKTKGLVDPHNEWFMGTFVSASGDAIINQAIRESDCILGIGYDPVETTYDWHLGENYHSVANTSTAFGSFNPDEAIGDVTELLTTLQDQYDGSPGVAPGRHRQVAGRGGCQYCARCRSRRPRSGSPDHRPGLAGIFAGGGPANRRYRSAQNDLCPSLANQHPPQPLCLQRPLLNGGGPARCDCLGSTRPGGVRWSVCWVTAASTQWYRSWKRYNAWASTR